MNKRTLLLATLVAIVGTSITALAADKGRKRDLFTTADKDGDGKVTQAEFVAATKGRGDESKSKSRFSKLDTNSDGSLSKEEFAALTDKKGEGKKGERKKK